ncbi:MAG: hypothetical protein WD294_08105 [Phycisphaeraceae bacterium]
MAKTIEELDYQQTPMGDLILRRRTSVSLPGTMVYEVKLNGDFLMSSLVNTSEKALADLALELLRDRPCDVLVGGLGLGCTAQAALAYANVHHVHVVEYLEPVIAWHKNRLVPAADQLMDDPRCELIHGDFFEHVGEGPSHSELRYDAILLDIDHSPESLLDSRHGRFYASDGLVHLTKHLRPGGVFALWSADPPPGFLLDRLKQVFASVDSHVVEFNNPLLHEQDENTIVVAQLAPEDGGARA